MSPTLFTGPHGDHRRYQVSAGDDGQPLRAQSGGEGLVFKAVRLTDRTEVALKMLTSLPLDAFPQLHARTDPLRSVRHPNLMVHLETFVGTALISDPHPAADAFDVMYSVAEWIDGTPLAEATHDQPILEQLGWVTQIALGVDHLHNYRPVEAPEGIVHRDIKPSNIRVRPDGSAVLLDFGIARPHQANDLTEGAGTFNWRAPEVLTGPDAPGPASDTWALGALGHWVLTGEPPRLDGRSAARERMLSSAREHRLGDPPGLATHLARPLASDPADRPTDLGRWARDLAVIAARRHIPLRDRRSIRVAAVVLLAAPVIGLAGTAGVDRLEGTTTPTVLGTQVDRVTVQDPWNVPCDGDPATTPGSGAPADSEIRYGFTEAEPPPSSTTTSTTPPATDPIPPPEIGTATVVTRDAEVGRPLQVSPRADVPTDPLELSAAVLDSGTFLIEWTCDVTIAGSEWTLNYAADDGQTGSSTVRGVEPVVEILASAAPRSESDARIHIPVGPPVVLPAEVRTTRLGADPNNLGLEGMTVLSSNPEILSVRRLPDDPDQTTSVPSFEFTARQPGDVTVTARLRTVETIFEVTVDP